MVRLVIGVAVLSLVCISSAAAKQRSVFYPPEVLQTIQRNANTVPWAMEAKKNAITAAEPWLQMSDDAIWELMVPTTITRSWMVWSNGFCPSCKASVTMYNWKIAPFENPWKVQCPTCQEYFPKNDFKKFYQSGLDARGIFNPHLANRSLLYNADHPDPQDSLHRFGVDDGEGYVDGGYCWRFIGYYLVKGQWKRVVVPGVRALSTAYVITGDKRYARKAAILLNRIADVYPQFDYGTQGMSYEGRDPIIGHGYVSLWHDACEETRELVLAYDMIYEAMTNDQHLVSFIQRKTNTDKTAKAASSIARIRRNIERGLMEDVLQNRRKVESNFPHTEALFAIIETVRDWPRSRVPVQARIDALVRKATAVDGLSGEKGLSGYSTTVSNSLARFLSLYSRVEPNYLESLVKRHPNLKKTFRFHVDTWFNASYYPKIGDAGGFGQKAEHYAGVSFARDPVSLETPYAFTSTQSLFWQLYRITRDPVYIQILYRENGSTSAGLPYDILEDDPTSFEARVDTVIAQYGAEIRTASFNKERWCLAMLVSGTGNSRRAVWIDYDIGGNHSQADAMNIGLFARGLDLLSGFGYPPVQFGGWYSPKALWYRKTASHNTVVVNGLDQVPGAGERESAPLAEQLNPLKNRVAGKTISWMPGQQVQGIRVGGKHLYRSLDLQQYDRSVFLIDRHDEDFYVLDIFRVRGGSDHAKFTHGYFGDVTTQGLNLKPQPDFGFSTEMRAFHYDDNPAANRRVVWNIKDQLGFLPPGQQVHLEYVDASSNVEIARAESWTVSDWLPSVLLRHRGPAPLATAFVGVWEVFERASGIERLRRTPLLLINRTESSDMDAALAVDMNDGGTDFIVAVDNVTPRDQPPARVRVPEWALETDGNFCLVRRDAAGRIRKLALSGGTYIRLPEFELTLNSRTNFIEVDVDGISYTVRTPNARSLRTCRRVAK